MNPPLKKIPEMQSEERFNRSYEQQERDAHFGKEV